MKLHILYEDKNVLVIDKPAGLAVHPDVRTLDEVTVASLVAAYDPSIIKVGEPMRVAVAGGETVEIPRPGIVHRIDKETSGVLIVARNQKTFLSLKQQFQDHTIEKVYRAFVYGYVPYPKASLAKGKRGRIDAPIGRSPKDIRMWTAGRGVRPVADEQGGKEAVTEYDVLAHFSDIDTDGKVVPQTDRFSYIEVYPKTGRTHQIRVHMRYINYPLVSDPLYRGAREKALGMDRLALHAYSITFTTGTKRMTVEAPLPTDFKKVLKEFVEKHAQE